MMWLIVVLAIAPAALAGQRYDLAGAAHAVRRETGATPDD
jgi:hypothetical protein